MSKSKTAPEPSGAMAGFVLAFRHQGMDTQTAHGPGACHNRYTSGAGFGCAARRKREAVGKKREDNKRTGPEVQRSGPVR